MDEQEHSDFLRLADGVDHMREVLRVMVAGLVSDGFTDREARAIIASVFKAKLDGEEEE